MGTFFSNIQVCTRDESKETIRHLIINFLKLYLTKNGYIEANENDEADRTIAISQIVNASWISIYDEAFDYQNIKQFDKITSDLSDELKTRAIGITVHDSDILRLAMFYNGYHVGEYSNVKKRRKQIYQANDFFKGINVTGSSIDDFSNAFTKKHVFVEGILHDIAEITKMDLTQCGTRGQVPCPIQKCEMGNIYKIFTSIYTKDDETIINNI